MSTMYPFLVISYPVTSISYPSHFVPKSFRTHFGHFIPSSTWYEMSFESQFVPNFGQIINTLVISYLGSVHIKCISLNTYFSCEHVCLYILFSFNQYSELRDHIITGALCTGITLWEAMHLSFLKVDIKTLIRLDGCLSMYSL